MGKATKWFRGLLGLKKPNDSRPPSPSTTHQPPPPYHFHPNPNQNQNPKPPKPKWSFVKSYREKDHHHNRRSEHGISPVQPHSSADDGGVDQGKHAIAVAAATAAVAEAAVAAAQAAAAVVRLTNSGRSTNATAASSVRSTAAYVSGTGAGFGTREEWAAVKIQSHFRAYLARRALRALKALVKLQALVRGHLLRKQTADMMRRLQALLRAQARARAGRFHNSESPHSSTKSSQFHHPGPATPEKFEHAIRTKSMKNDQSLMLKRNSSKSNGRVLMGTNRPDRKMKEFSLEQQGSFSKPGLTDDEKGDKIVEIDTGKPRLMPKCRNLFKSSHLSLGSNQNNHSFTTSKDSTAHQTVQSPSSCEVQSLSLEFSQDVEETSFCTAENSPQFYSASSKGGSSRRGPFTPTKSDGIRSCLSGYSTDHPNYMSFTEASKAKMRSLSAPKQRPQFERSSSTKRYSVYGCNDTRSTTQRAFGFDANLPSKAYPGSGRLDRRGMPVRSDAAGFSGGR